MKTGLLDQIKPNETRYIVHTEIAVCGDCGKSRIWNQTMQAFGCMCEGDMRWLAPEDIQMEWNERWEQNFAGELLHHTLEIPDVEDEIAELLDGNPWEPVTVTHEILVCHDCACVLANGECVVMSPEIGKGYEDIAPYLIDLWRVRWPVEMGRIVLACEYDEDGNETCSPNYYRTCDLCERSDSSSDHKAVVLSR